MISKVYHLADLHIRKGSLLESRYDEYNQVFNRCIAKIKDTYIPKESICVICGDIFHHKLQISSNGIILFNNFISNLASLMPTFIIQGNHDLIQENNDDNNDLIKAILSNDISNVIYLNKTGTYQYDNINFGLVSIKDILQQNTSYGLVDTLPKFPEPKKNFINIALSHSTVKNSYLHNYTKNYHGIPIEWFKGYDIVMLGDIHLQSTKYNKKNNLYYGYSGSLIQQDFGEGLFNHGFLEWDISDTIKVNKHHVYNSIGKAIIRLINEDELFINAQNYVPFSQFLKMDDIPEMLNIRLYIKSNIEETINHIRTKLKSINKECIIDVIHSNLLTEQASTQPQDQYNVDISELNSTQTIIDFFKSYENTEVYGKNSDWIKLFSNYDKFLLNESLNVAEIIAKKVKTKNEKLRKHIDTLGSTKVVNSVININIKEIQFDWILSFGKGNKFIFDKDRVILINAPNGYGKSAFLECIMISLFGESIPSRYNKHTSVSIINKSKPFNCDTSNTKILFTLNGKEYTIVRVFFELKDSKNKNIKRLFAKNVELYENDELIKSGANVVNKWVLNNICSIQDFLLSSLISQNFDQDFFKFKPQDQMTTLDTFLKMENINSLTALLKDSKKEYQDLINHINTYINANQPSKISTYSSLEDIQNNIGIIAQQKHKLKLELQILQAIQVSQTVHVQSDFIPDLSPEELLVKEKSIQQEMGLLQVVFDGYANFEIDISDPSIYLNDEFNTHQNIIKIDLKKDLKEIIIEIKTLTEEYDLLTHHLELHNSKKPLTTVSREDCLTFFHTYKKFHSLYANYEIPSELNYTCEDVENIAYDINLVSESIENLQNMLTTNTKLSNFDHYSFNQNCWACRKNFTENQHIINTIEYIEKKQHLEKYSFYMKNKEDIDKYNVMNKEKQSWDLQFEKVDVYEKWLNIKSCAENEIKELYEQISYKQKQLKEAYDYQVRYTQLVKFQNELDYLMMSKQYYVERKKDVQMQLDKLVVQERDAYVELSKYEIDNVNITKFENTQKTYHEFLELLINRIDLFEHFLETIKKYKTWIYEEKLLPLVITKSNKLLSFIFSQRPLQLKFKFLENNVYYTIIDEGNEINIEKLSGAQSFAVSLSFRLALSSIGISKIACNQLFIDEGFCSYDDTNLSQVPLIFQNIRRMYNSIIFVSHLEDIKTCADKIVHISRKNGISKIMN